MRSPSFVSAAQGSPILMTYERLVVRKAVAFVSSAGPVSTFPWPLTKPNWGEARSVDQYEVYVLAEEGGVVV